MKNCLTVLKMSDLILLSLMSLLLTTSQASAANRIFPLYLKNGFNHDVTFQVEMGNCYQGTGYGDPSKLIHGPIPPGGRAKMDVALNQNHGCPDREGVFYVKTTDPRHQAGKGQSFIFDNSGNLGMREGSEEFSSYLSAKSAQDESYTWTIFKPIPLVEPTENSLIRIRNITSRQYLTQAHSGQNDSTRNATVWPLPSNKNNSFIWVMRDAGGGYWHLINLASGLALTLDPQGQNVSNWGQTRNKDPKQLWRFERHKRSYMIINKASGQGLRQAYGGVNPDKRNVTVWPDQNFAGDGWAWRLELGGHAELVKVTLQTVEAIKTSTGQDVGTEILFGAIEAAITGGAGAAKKAGYKGFKITAKEVIRGAGKELAESAIEEGQSALEDRAREVSGANDYEDALKDNLRNQSNAVGTAMDAMDALDQLEQATSLQNAFNFVYGESPDDLRINVNGVSIWPNGGRDSRKIKSQQILPVHIPFIFDRSEGLAIQLVEYDSGSNDDSLGWIGFTAEELAQTRLYKDVLVSGDSEGSLYQLTFTVGPVGMDAADIEMFEQQNMQLAEERERKAEQVEKNRLAQAETNRKLAQAAITPSTATLRMLGSENGLSRIPLNRYIENPEKLLISPALYLEVTFANGSKSNVYYHIQAPDNVIFDDVSGDPDDIIKLVYTPNSKGGESPGQVTATGNGVGTAYINVSFRNAPGVTASVAVEVVDTGPVSLAQAPPVAASTNASAQLFNRLATGSRAEINLPLTVDIFKMTQIHSICPSGCELDYAEPGLYVTMVMPGNAANDVSMEVIDARVGQVLGGTYCAGDVKEGNGIMLFAIDDMHGTRVANTVFRPVDCAVGTAHSEPRSNDGEAKVNASSNSANGKYSDLLQTLNCPSDKSQYGESTDEGYWGGGAWCGQQGKAGYWVWVAPNWYVWGSQR